MICLLRKQSRQNPPPMPGALPETQPLPTSEANGAKEFNDISEHLSKMMQMFLSFPAHQKCHFRPLGGQFSAVSKPIFAS